MNFKKSILTITLVTLLSGCQATQRQNATTGELETNTATKGALLGAVTGAAIGAATGDNSSERKRRALYGAAAGGLVGGSVGYNMDQQEKALRTELTNSGVQVKRISENELQLVMEKGIGFDSGSSLISSDIYASLNSVALILGEYPESRLQIIGHTDSSGATSENQTISEQRAKSVGDYLVNQKVASGRIVSQGMGERYPLCDNSTKQGRACNRRVEINILSL
ncbi:OmpA family protein [Aliivibrio wodanis]|uniref:OmpA family protein n=1 Tax=Aliivibrio wodanis TaxID=80852 RepID=UPI00406CB3B7